MKQSSPLLHKSARRISQRHFGVNTWHAITLACLEGTSPTWLNSCVTASIKINLPFTDLNQFLIAQKYYVSIVVHFGDLKPFSLLKIQVARTDIIEIVAMTNPTTYSCVEVTNFSEAFSSTFLTMVVLCLIHFQNYEPPIDLSV